MARRKQKHYLKKPRRIGYVLVTAMCHAARGLFLAWDEMEPEGRDEFNLNGPIPCEGGGVPGEWCEECRFGTVDHDREYEPL